MGRRILPAILLFLLLLPLPLAGTSALASESLPDLVRDLGGTDASRRWAAYRALIRRRDRAALGLLRRALPSWNHTSKYYGVLVVDRYPAEEARRTWRALLETDDPFLRLWAGTALLRRGEKNTLEKTVQALTAPGVPPPVRVRMLTRLGRRIHPRLMDGVRTLLKPGEHATVLAQVITILYRRRDHKAIGHIGRLLDDERPGVRALAAVWLYDIGEVQRAKELADDLRQGIGYTEFALVATILSANRRVVDEILDAVVEHLEKETNPILIVQQMKLLGRFHYAKARPVLRKLLASRNETVARAAFDILVTMSGPLREDTLKPLLRGDDVERKLWAAEALRQRDDTSGIAVVIYALQSGTMRQRETAASMLGSYTMDIAVEPLLDALLDEHAAVRKVAVASLQKVLRRLFPYRRLNLSRTGYDPAGDAATRAAAADTIRAWWRQARTADW